MGSARRIATLAAVATSIVGLSTTAAVAATPRVPLTGPLPAAPAAAPAILTGTVPALVRYADRVGPTDPSRQLRIALALEPRDQAALDAYVAAEYTPGSPEFHGFLQPAEFGDRFGAPAAAVAQVQGALRGLGLRVDAPLANHLVVNATGSVAQLERAFGVQIDDFSLPGGEHFFANTSDIALAEPLQGLTRAVVGLDDAAQLQPRLALRPPSLSLPPASVQALNALQPSRGRTQQAQPRAAAAPAASPSIVPANGGASPCPTAATTMPPSGSAFSGYTAPDLAQAYDFNGLYALGVHGEGMNAALVEYDDFHDSDVAAFESCYSISPDPVRRRYVDGGNGAPPTDGGGEVPLDIDVLLEMVPSLSHLYVYVAANNSTISELDLYNDFATDDLAPVMSSSWGLCEEGTGKGYTQALSTIVEEAAAQGQQILDAAGDSGAVDCRGFPVPASQTLSTEEEASIPWVTAVGGTNLNPLTLTGGVHKEVTWNDALGAGGGGISGQWLMPAWQKAAGIVDTNSSGAPCGAPSGQYCREVPDISANADILGAPREGGATPNPDGAPGAPGYTYYCGQNSCSLTGPLPIVGTPNGWQINGGTSAATPLTAASFVLYDELAHKQGLNGLGFLNPSIYRVAHDPTKYAADFFDITSDTNDDEFAMSPLINGSNTCPSSSCNPNHMFPAGTGYDMASGWGSYDAGKLGPDLIADAGTLDVTPDAVDMYGYTNGPATQQSVSVSSGFASEAISTASDAAWLTAVNTGGTPGSVRLTATPASLAVGTYTGHVTVSAPGHTATVTVTYSVTPRAAIAVDQHTLSFSEEAVDSSGNPITATCGVAWQDELNGDGQPPDPNSRRTLTVSNAGASGSVLHWSAYFPAPIFGWLGPDFEPTSSAPSTTPPQGGLVQTTGALDSGSSYGLKLASVVSGGGISPGLYHGQVVIRDLADPNDSVVVPASLLLGDSSDIAKTPHVVVAPTAINVTLSPGGLRPVPLLLTDGGHSCGYRYSAAIDSGRGGQLSWAHVLGNPLEGALGGPDNSSRSGPTSGFVVTVFDANGLAPGVYHGTLAVSAFDAEPTPTLVPLTLTVSGAQVTPPVTPPLPTTSSAVPGALPNSAAASPAGAPGAALLGLLGLLAAGQVRRRRDRDRP